MPENTQGAVERQEYGSYFGWDDKKPTDVILSSPEPYLYELPFGEDVHYIVHPVVADGLPISFGPMFLPVIPLWPLAFFISGTNKACHVTIAWSGDAKMADNIIVTHVSRHGRSIGTPKLLGPRRNFMEYKYTFADELTDQSELILDCADSQISVTVPLMSERGWGIALYISLLGNTRGRQSPKKHGTTTKPSVRLEPPLI